MPRRASKYHHVRVKMSACPTDVLEMVPWDGCKSGQIASSPRVEDCVGCKRCETACPTDFLSVRVYLGAETTRSLGLAY